MRGDYLTLDSPLMFILIYSSIYLFCGNRNQTSEQIAVEGFNMVEREDVYVVEPKPMTSKYNNISTVDCVS